MLAHNPLDCPRCGCRKILRGHNLASSGRQPMRFGYDPPRNRFLRLLFPCPREIQVPGEFRLCLVCGLVWSAVDPIRTLDQVRAAASRHLRAELGLNERSVMADDELDGPG